MRGPGAPMNKMDHQHVYSSYTEGHCLGIDERDSSIDGGVQSY